MKAQNESSAVVLKTDSVLGVALDIYELHNVQAELSLQEPDTADHSVLMYTRTADYTAMGKYIGSLVVDGEQKRSDVSRLGYCAIAKGNMVIGISRFDDMCEHMVARDGSYFRQFLLVSNGELPQRFFLHGKVERKALARTADDRLCIIATRHPETLWDFADALRAQLMAVFVSSRPATPKPCGTSPMPCANMAMWMPYTLPVATRAVSTVLPTAPPTSRRKPPSIAPTSTTA